MFIFNILKLFKLGFVIVLNNACAMLPIADVDFATLQYSSYICNQYICNGFTKLYAGYL